MVAGVALELELFAGRAFGTGNAGDGFAVVSPEGVAAEVTGALVWACRLKVASSPDTARRIIFILASEVNLLHFRPESNRI